MVGHSVPKANLRVLDHLIGARHELSQVFHAPCLEDGAECVCWCLFS